MPVYKKINCECYSSSNIHTIHKFCTNRNSVFNKESFIKANYHRGITLKQKEMDIIIYEIRMNKPVMFVFIPSQT